MTPFEHLVTYTNERLASAGLTLSPHGLAGITKRWKLKEEAGGYSAYWKEYSE